MDSYVSNPNLLALVAGLEYLYIINWNEQPYISETYGLYDTQDSIDVATIDISQYFIYYTSKDHEGKYITNIFYRG